MRNLEWVEGKPEELIAGMVIQDGNGFILIVGNINEDCSSSPDKFPDGGKTLSQTVRWAWLCKPHELEWLEDMAKRRVRK